MANLDKDDVCVSSPEYVDDVVSVTGLLTFPASGSSSCAKETTGHNPPSSSSRQLVRDRLFIGNLHPAVDEYTLLQIFAKFGKVTKLDFLFHKSGALKGKPRGYAFLEYGSHNEAQKALNSANGKLLHGRKLAVTFANQAPSDVDGGIRQRKTMMSIGRPTTLSMLKSNTGNRNKDDTTNKIAMMEAKLRELEASKPKHDSEPGTSILPASNLPTHPSLPLKPPPTIPNFDVPQPHKPIVHKLTGSSAPLSRPSGLSSLVSSDHSSITGSEPPSKKTKLSSTSGPSEAAKRKSGLSGVKIVKKRTSPLLAPPSASNDDLNVDPHQH